MTRRNGKELNGNGKGKRRDWKGKNRLRGSKATREAREIAGSAFSC